MTDRNVQNADIKDMYEEKIASTYKDNYEYNRWFTNPRLRLDYAMTYRSIQHHLAQTTFTSALELGPGPGTWTRLLYRQNPGAKLDLVDISEAMAEQFTLEMRESSTVSYTVGDFLTYEPTQQYDLFFSSRAVEYFEDLDKLFDMINRCLAPGGTAVIVTKNPDHFSIGKLLKSYQERTHHTGQIHLDRMRELISSRGLTDTTFSPCIIRVPLLDRFMPQIAEKLFTQSFQRTVDELPALAESYVVTFKKPTSA